MSGERELAQVSHSRHASSCWSALRLYVFNAWLKQILYVDKCYGALGMRFDSTVSSQHLELEHEARIFDG